MNTGLEGKVAIITGAGRNIGRETARQLAEEGVRLVLCTRRSKELLEEAAHEIAGLGVPVITGLCDVTQWEQVEALVKKAYAEFGSVDILVNNAVYRVQRPFLETSLEVWHQNIAVNLTGPYNTCHAILPGMMERRWGRIINYSGVAAYIGAGVAKGAVKLGIVGFTQALAREFGPYNITANCIAPGAIEVVRDPGLERSPDERQVWERLPIGRFGQPKEIAAMVVYLASEQAAYTTGQCFAVNGGYYFK